MAIATPVLERLKEATQKEVRSSYKQGNVEDELHNSRIRNAYQQLINPETKLSDLRSATPVQQAPEQVVQAYAPAQQVIEPVAPVQPEIRFVEGARTDADLFRADSAINRRVTFVQTEANPVMAVQQSASEEENEDSMPTVTTMQYNAVNKESDIEGMLVNRSEEKQHIRLTKRDKVVIAVVVSIIVALFALIIVNSVIISGLNSDLGSLQTSLNSARGTYESVMGEIAEYQSNFDETLRALAESLGMIR